MCYGIKLRWSCIHTHDTSMVACPAAYGLPAPEPSAEEDAIFNDLVLNYSTCYSSEWIDGPSRDTCLVWCIGDQLRGLEKNFQTPCFVCDYADKISGAKKEKDRLLDAARKKGGDDVWRDTAAAGAWWTVEVARLREEWLLAEGRRYGEGHADLLREERMADVLERIRVFGGDTEGEDGSLPDEEIADESLISF